MENIMNRQCNCMNDMSSNNSTMNSNISMELSNNCDPTRDEMMEKIKCLNFAITELGLYLDTHPDDEKALCLHRKYCKEYRDITDKYQKVYGPLSIKFPCNKWRWLEEPWPWEGGKF